MSLIYLSATVLLSIPPLCNGSPANNATSGQPHITEGWVSDPDGRGTFTLIETCILTLGLCVWSAMHLNIPKPGESEIEYWIRNSKWALIGLFAPELVVFIAWKQWNSARTLINEMNAPGSFALVPMTSSVFPPNQIIGYNRNESISRTKWTMTHGFYAGMGGFNFIFDNKIIPSSASSSPRLSRLTLTARGVLLLAQCGHLPEISKEDIKDKSKADGLAKAIVCVQAAWFIIQCLARLILGLSITLLEVNTVGHIFCAFVIYMLWWHKPRSIAEPTKLKGPWISALSAYFYMSSQVSGKATQRVGLLLHKWARPEISDLKYTILPSQGFMPDDPENILRETSDDAVDWSLKKKTTSNENIKLAEYAQRNPSAATYSTYEEVEKGNLTPEDDDIMQKKRWKKASEAIQVHQALWGRLDPSDRHSQEVNGIRCEWGKFPAEELVCEGIKNWNAHGLLPGTGGLLMGMVLWCACTIFGAIHTAAWYEYFPTDVEKWIWRSSALWITFSGLVWLLINLIAQVFPKIDRFWDGTLELQTNRALLAFLLTLCAICGISFLFARSFLVIEAFISIRRLPTTAYATPEWMQLIPHF